MYIFMKPLYGINYRPGHLFFLFRYNYPLIPGISWIPYQTDFHPWRQLDFYQAGLCIDENKAITADVKQGVTYCELRPFFEDPMQGIIFRKPKRLNERGCSPLIEEARSFIGLTYDFPLFISHALIHSSFLKNILSERIKNEILRFFHAKGRCLSSEFIMHCLIKSHYSDSSNTRLTPLELFSDPCLENLKKNLPLKYQSFSTIMP